MRSVDTNVLVRLLTGDDEQQAADAETFIAGGAWVSQVVLVEAAWVLSSAYRLSPGELAAAIEMLLSHHQLSLQDSHVVAAALQQFRRRPSLGFSDCLVLEVSRAAGRLPLGTFDRALAKLDGAERV